MRLFAMRNFVRSATANARRDAFFQLGDPADTSLLFKFRRIGRVPTFSKKSVSTLSGLRRAIGKTGSYIRSNPYQFKSGLFGLRNYQRGTWAKYRPLYPVMNRIRMQATGRLPAAGLSQSIRRNVQNRRRWGNQYGSGFLLHPKIYSRARGMRGWRTGPASLLGLRRNH